MKTLNDFTNIISNIKNENDLTSITSEIMTSNLIFAEKLQLLELVKKQSAVIIKLQKENEAKEFEQLKETLLHQVKTVFTNLNFKQAINISFNGENVTISKQVSKNNNAGSSNNSKFSYAYVYYNDNSKEKINNVTQYFEDNNFFESVYYKEIESLHSQDKNENNKRNSMLFRLSETDRNIKLKFLKSIDVEKIVFHFDNDSVIEYNTNI